MGLSPSAKTVSVPSVAVETTRKKSAVRQLVFLAVATIGLIIFILVMGDLRRKSAAMTRAQSYAAELSGRIGAGGALPLELSPHALVDSPSQTYRFESLGRDDAFRLRKSAVPVLAAWTGMIRADVLSKGRAVIMFEHGAFRVAWTGETAFHFQLERQTSALRSGANQTK